MTPATVIRYSELLPKPWRNGLGVTRTIRPMPDGGGWSLSIATIERVAEFSVIPGARRVQLAIDPVQLVIDGTEVLLGQGEQVRFTGVQRVTGASVAESSQVLNLISARETLDLEVVVVRAARDIPVGALALVVLDGTLEVSGAELSFLDTVLLGVGEGAQGLAGSGEFAVISAAR